MDRIEIDVVTNERKVVPLTPEEIAQSQAAYAEWEANEAKRKAQFPKQLDEQIAFLQAQIDALKG